MSDNGHAGAPLKAGARSKAGRFDQMSIALHWLTLTLVAAQVTTAWLAGLVGGGAAAILLTTHRSVGVVTWLVVAGRLLWRHSSADIPPFPATMPRLQQRVATLNEYALYALLLLQPVTGLGATLFHGRPFSLFVWQAPALFEQSKPAFHTLHVIHELGAWALLAVIGLHAGAALFHGLVLRDGVLQRMLPWTAPGPDRA